MFRAAHEGRAQARTVCYAYYPEPFRRQHHRLLGPAWINHGRPSADYHTMHLGSVYRQLDLPGRDHLASTPKRPGWVWYGSQLGTAGSGRRVRELMCRCGHAR